LSAAAKGIRGGVDILLIDPIVSVIGGKVDYGNNAGHRENTLLSMTQTRRALPYWLSILARKDRSVLLSAVLPGRTW
jgi:hypothetical protein